MIFNDIIKESEINAWNRLILLLDKLFSFNSGGKSKVRRVNQGFDKKAGEHVIQFEYRVKAENQSPIPNRPNKTRLIADKKK